MHVLRDFHGGAAAAHDNNRRSRGQKQVNEIKRKYVTHYFIFASRLNILQFHFKINNFGHIEIHAMEDFVRSSLYTVRHHILGTRSDVSYMTNRISIFSSYTNVCNGFINKSLSNIYKYMVANFVRMITYAIVKNLKVGKLWKPFINSTQS